jgi:glycerophosphoryl diester phosphodiesterase
MKRPVVYAHRGASGYEIENTIPSFELAVKMKADAVEFDVQLTSDGGVIVFHDFTLGRLFNVDTAVSGLMTDEIKNYNFKNPADGKPVGIPFLKEVLAAISHKIRMNIELKNDDDKPDRIQALCSRVYGLIQKYNLIKEAVVSSFNIDAIRQMRRLSQDIRLAVLADQLSGEASAGLSGGAGTLSFYINTAKELAAEAINISYASVDGSLIREIHDSGFNVNVYTINNDELVRMVVKEGVDGLFTNYPDRAIKVIEQEIKQSSIQ